MLYLVVLPWAQDVMMGRMEKQETEMKWKLEMETGNGNWKWKLEKEITGATFSS